MSNEKEQNKGGAGAVAAATKPEKVRDVKLVAVHEIVIPDELGTRQVVQPKDEFTTDAKTAESLLKSGAARKPASKKAEGDE